MKEIREAVEYANGLIGHFEDEGDVLSASMIVRLKNLAESVLAVGAKMPERSNEPAFYCPMEILSHAEYKGRKEAIEQCTLAITGALLSEEEIESIIEDSCEDNGGCGVAINPEKCATAIHSAQMEKLEGKVGG